MTRALLVAATNVLAALSWTLCAPLGKWAGFCIFFPLKQITWFIKRGFIHNRIQELSTACFKVNKKSSRKARYTLKSIHMCVCVLERVYLLHNRWKFPYAFWKTQAHLSVVAHQSSEAEAWCIGAIMKKRGVTFWKQVLALGGLKAGLVWSPIWSAPLGEVGWAGTSLSLCNGHISDELLNACKCFPWTMCSSSSSSVFSRCLYCEKAEEKKGKKHAKEHTRRKIQLWTGTAFYLNL